MLEAEVSLLQYRFVVKTYDRISGQGVRIRYSRSGFDLDLQACGRQGESRSILKLVWSMLVLLVKLVSALGSFAYFRYCGSVRMCYTLETSDPERVTWW
jgi:hypothetical protein